MLLGVDDGRFMFPFPLPLHGNCKIVRNNNTVKIFIYLKLLCLLSHESYFRQTDQPTNKTYRWMDRQKCIQTDRQYASNHLIY